MPYTGDLQLLLDRIKMFVADRDWEQFHTPKDMAISLSLEAAEVLEHFQWKTPDEIENYLSQHKNEIADELVDVMHWVLLMSDRFNIDLMRAAERKITANETKYPIAKSKGRYTKWNQLDK